jgi:hypothetical protein
MATARARRLPVVAVAASLALALPLLLSGCSLVHLPGSSSRGGGISIPGVGSVGSGKLPSDFPSDIPVVAGDVVSGASIGSGDKKVWNVSIKVSGLDAFDTINTELTGAGFTAVDGKTSTTAKVAAGVYTKGDYDVAVVVTAGGGKTVIANYTITKGAGGN